MTAIREAINIDAVSLAKLEEAGVRTLDQLIEIGASSAGRMRLADETQLDDSTIKAWVHQADLMRVAGIGPTFAHLLCEVGVCTTPKLAYRSTESLYAELMQQNSVSHSMKQLPSITEIHTFITQAKRLPKLIRH